MIDTIGENGLVSTGLVFGVIQIFPIIITQTQTKKKRLQVLAAVQGETNFIMAERNIVTALIRYIPPAANRFYKM